MEEWQKPQTLTIWLLIIILVVSILVVSIVVFTRLYIKKLLNAQKRLSLAKVEFQQKLSENSIHILERERNRVALNLHDNIINRLNLALLSLNQRQQQEQIELLLRNCIDNTRNISHEMHPPMLSQSSIYDLIKEISTPLQNQYQFEFIFSDDSREEISELIKLQLVRIIQEAINNIIKHSQATKIEISLRLAKNIIGLKIADNGVGFDPDKIKEGLGLSNITLRVQMLKGTFKYKSRISRGTVLLIAFQQLNTQYENSANR